MAKSQPIVEINGKSYNPATGRLLSSSPSHVPKKTAPRNIDGVVRTHTVHHQKQSPKPTPAIINKPAPTVSHDPAKTAHSLHSRAKRSSTLVRKAVSKPEPYKKLKANKARGIEKVSLDPSVRSTVNPEREKRAKNIHLHHMVNRFGLPVTAPSANPPVMTIEAPSSEPEFISSPSPTTPKKIHPIMPSTVVSSTHKQLNRMLDNALETATSHKQRHHKHTKRRLVPLASLCLAGLLLVGFYAYQNVPNAALQVAMKRSGVHASLPGYTPSGFAFSGPIRYNDGQLSISYATHDNSDRNYDIKVKKSNWNNDTLVSEFIQPETSQYQSMQSKGKTVYIYDGQHATWLEQGSWYTIDGNARLNSDQLLKIADSI